MILESSTRCLLSFPCASRSAVDDFGKFSGKLQQHHDPRGIAIRVINTKIGDPRILQSLLARILTDVESFSENLELVIPLKDLQNFLTYEFNENSR